MKTRSSSATRSAILLLPVFAYAAQAAMACGPGESSGPTYLQAVATTVTMSALLLGTPFLAFGFIHLLAGNTRPGLLRICTFIGAIGFAVLSIIIVERC